MSHTEPQPPKRPRAPRRKRPAPMALPLAADNAPVLTLPELGRKLHQLLRPLSTISRHIEATYSAEAAGYTEPSLIIDPSHIRNHLTDPLEDAAHQLHYWWEEHLKHAAVTMGAMQSLSWEARTQSGNAELTHQLEAQLMPLEQILTRQQIPGAFYDPNATERVALPGERIPPLPDNLCQAGLTAIAQARALLAAQRAKASGPQR